MGGRDIGRRGFGSTVAARNAGGFIAVRFYGQVAGGLAPV